MKLSRRLLAIFLAAALIMGSVAVGAYADIDKYTDYDANSNPYTAKYSIELSKVTDTATGASTPYEIKNGSITAAAGDIIKADVYFQTNYFAVQQQFTVAYDSAGLLPTTNVANGLTAGWAYATDRTEQPTATVLEFPGYPADAVGEGTFENPYLYTDGWKQVSSKVDAGNFGAAKNNLIPTPWRGSGTTATTFRNNTMNCYKVIYGPDTDQSGHRNGYAMIVSEPVLLVTFYVTVASSVKDGDTFAIGVPAEGFRNSNSPQNIGFASRAIPSQEDLDVEGLEQAVYGAFSGSKLAQYSDTYENGTNKDRVIDVSEGYYNVVIGSGEEPPVQEVDKTALETALANAQEVNADEYTATSYGALEDAVATGQQVYNSDTATQDEVDAAADAINAAIDELVPRTDKSVLIQKIAEADAAANNEAAYTPGSFAAFIEAYDRDAAQEVVENTDASEDEVQGAIDDITAALALLKEPADKTGLEQAIEEAQDLNSTDYTTSSWSALETALSDAQGTYGDAEATQEEVNAAEQALRGAMNALQAAADKTALIQMIADADAAVLNEAAYTPASYAAFIAAYDRDEAQAVVENGDATTQMVEDAIAPIEAALALLRDKADFSALQQAYDDASALDPNAYTSSSYANLPSALTAAAEVLANANAEQAAVDGALADLNAATTALVPIGKKDALLTAIADATALLANEDAYTPASWTAADLENAIAAAQGVADSDDVDQIAVDDAVTALNAKVALLELRADKEALIQKISEADAALQNEDAYTPSSFAAFAAAYDKDAAQNVVENGDATAQMITDAITDITNALALLQEKADKGALEQAIAAAEEEILTEETATTDSWTDFSSALEAARQALANEDIAQADVDTAAANLIAAQEALAARPGCDYTALNDAIEAFEAVMGDEDLYTEETFQAASDAYAVAKAIEPGLLQDDAGANQQSINNAAAALNAAVEGLITKASLVNKDALKTALDVYETLSEDDYTPATWAAYAQAVADGTDVYNNATATQEEVDTAEGNVTAAYNALKTKADKQALENAITAANAVDSDDYTPSSFAAFAAAYDADAAQTVLNNAEADQDTVDAAAKAVTDALALLQEKADKDALEAAINSDPAYDEDNATDDSWAAYQAALETAQNVFGDPEADQETVDNATADLNAAAAAVAQRGLCDYRALDDALALDPGDSKTYTAASWKVYANAKADAEAVDRELVDNKAGTNQAGINAAAEALVNAYNNLVVRTGAVTDVAVDLSEYYERAVMPYAVKVTGAPTKVQFIGSNGATRTFDRYNAAVSIVSYNAEDAEIDYVEEAPAYEIWTISTNLKADTYLAKARFGKEWENTDLGYEFTVEYAEFTQEFDPSGIVFEAAESGTGEFSNDVALDAVGMVDFRVTTPKDVWKIQFVLPTGATITLNAADYAQEDGDNLVWNITRKINANYLGDITLNIKGALDGAWHSDIAQLTLSLEEAEG